MIRAWKEVNRAYGRGKFLDSQGKLLTSLSLRSGTGGLGWDFILLYIKSFCHLWSVWCVACYFHNNTHILLLLLFWLCCTEHRILVLGPGIQPLPPAVEPLDSMEWVLTREVFIYIIIGITWYMSSHITLYILLYSVCVCVCVCVSLLTQWCKHPKSRLWGHIVYSQWR